MTRWQVAWEIAHSDEALGNAVDDLYVRFLGRSAEVEVLPYWTDAVRHGYRQQHVAFSISLSEEYRTLHAARS